jgi:hypothetical protein
MYTCKIFHLIWPCLPSRLPQTAILSSCDGDLTRRDPRPRPSTVNNDHVPSHHPLLPGQSPKSADEQSSNPFSAREKSSDALQLTSQEISIPSITANPSIMQLPISGACPAASSTSITGSQPPRPMVCKPVAGLRPGVRVSTARNQGRFAAFVCRGGTRACPSTM